ncbi:MAG: glycosyltransferase family 2 protein [Lachnospiraceae bacterium]|nr:glycosyltransferase family 2 protein [Lachnospiraceae bacterium]
MITISLCMIVKNEERVLARCLDSLIGLMDEIIIVDTGSTDKTKEIAKKYTDKVYDFAWVDDFSAARNFSFSKATMDYIYVADADEVLDEENRAEFQKLKEAMLPEVEIVQMYYANQKSFNTVYNFDKEYRPKLYKRLRNFLWVDPIHESVNLEPIVFDSDIVINHMPESNHANRDLSVFEKMVAKGQRLSKKMHNLYARELMIAGTEEEMQRAEECFLQTMSDTDRDMDEIKEAAVVLSHIYRIKQNTEMFFKYVMKDIVTEPSSEACYELGEFYLERGDFTEASNWYQNAMEGAYPILNIKYGDELPKKALVSCYEKIVEQLRKVGDYDGAKQYEDAIQSLLEE